MRGDYFREKNISKNPSNYFKQGKKRLEIISIDRAFYRVSITFQNLSMLIFSCKRFSLFMKLVAILVRIR